MCAVSGVSEAKSQNVSCVDEVGELDRVLDKEDGNVIPDKIPHAPVGIKLYGESAHVARGVRRAAGPRDCRKPDKDGGFLAHLEQRGAGEIG
jgi:hypothetical protein